MFNEDWFDETAQATLAGLARGLTVEGIIVEIGVWEGRSTVALAEATDREIHSCDTWLGSESDNTKINAAMRDVFKTWSDNVAACSNVYPHKMGWREYVPTITDPIALCFIDAEHTYLEVYENILGVLPKIAPGGILCGDDIGNVEVALAVANALGAYEAFGPIWVWQKPC